jgi:cytochrome c biogenesis protein CcmG/thiol:disulfide interchange protein DsbE
MTHVFSYRHIHVGLFLLLAMSAVLLPGCGGSRANQGAQHPAVGQPLLFLELEPLTGTGTPLTLASLKGRVTLMNFWATWCGPCKIEFPHITALAKKLSTDPKFQFISVNVDDETLAEAKVLAEKFLLEQRADIPTWADVTTRTRLGLGQQFWTGSIPLTLVIDRSGTIRGIWNGYMRGDEVAMETLVQELLGAQ